MNSKVVIVSESTCDLSPELINKYGIVVWSHFWLPLMMKFIMMEKH